MYIPIYIGGGLRRKRTKLRNGKSVTAMSLRGGYYIIIRQGMFYYSIVWYGIVTDMSHIYIYIYIYMYIYIYICFLSQQSLLARFGSTFCPELEGQLFECQNSLNSSISNPSISAKYIFVALDSSFSFSRESVVVVRASVSSAKFVSDWPNSVFGWPSFALHSPT